MPLAENNLYSTVGQKSLQQVEYNLLKLNKMLAILLAGKISPAGRAQLTKTQQNVGYTFWREKFSTLQ